MGDKSQELCRDEHGSLVARCRSFTSGLRAHPVGPFGAGGRAVLWNVCFMAGSMLTAVTANGLWHGAPVVLNLAVLVASLAIVAALLTALHRHRVRLTWPETFRVAVWSIALFQCWEVLHIGLLYARLALGWW
jgi:hypothetical protein